MALEMCMMNDTEERAETLSGRPVRSSRNAINTKPPNSQYPGNGGATLADNIIAARAENTTPATKMLSLEVRFIRVGWGPIGYLDPVLPATSGEQLRDE
jgi:hypothetical protein